MEIVTICYDDGWTRKVDVTGDSNLAIIKRHFEACRFVTHQQSPRPGLSSACVLPQAAADYDP